MSNVLRTIRFPSNLGLAFYAAALCCLFGAQTRAEEVSRGRVGKFVLDPPPFIDEKTAKKLEKPAAESVAHEMEWVIGHDGAEIKKYTFTYRGQETLSALERRAGPRQEEHLRNFLPFLMSGDRFTGAENPERGVFRWTVESAPRKDAPRPKSDLMLWLPVIDDPAAVTWAPVDGSRLEYRFRDVEVVNRMVLWMPWRLAQNETRIEETYTSEGMSARLEAKPVPGAPSIKTARESSRPLIGYEVVMTVRTRPGVIRRAELRKMNEEFTRWTSDRLNGVLIAGSDADVKGSRRSFYLLDSRWGIGWNWLRSGGRTFNTFGFQAEVSLVRPYSRRFRWHLLFADARLSDGGQTIAGTESPDFTVNFFDYGAGSRVEFRIPYGYRVRSPDSTIRFFEFGAALSARNGYFRFRGTQESSRGFSPALSLSARWGSEKLFTAAFLGAPASSAVVFRYQLFFREVPVESALVLGLEVF